MFTRADTALGTFCYMSPEMIVLKNEMRKGAGARIEITTKADIWYKISIYCYIYLI